MPAVLAPVLAAAVAVGITLPVHASGPATPLARCLAEADAVLQRERTRFAALEAELALGTRTQAPVVAAVPAFAAFEGAWRGHWRGLAARHLWRSVDSAHQLVVIRDGPLLRRGINRAGPDGTLCGLVEEPGGRLRRHQGSGARRGRGLVWITPWARYDESVRRTAAGPRYRIVERPHRALAPGFVAEYRPWHPKGTPARSAAAAGMRAHWTIDGDRLRVVLRGPTVGWIALAVGPGPDLPGSRVFLARVLDDRAEVAVHAAVPGGHHRTDETALDVAGRERPARGTEPPETVVSFTVRLAPGDPKTLPLRAGAPYRLWLAWSHHDDFAHHSTVRRAVDVRL